MWRGVACAISLGVLVTASAAVAGEPDRWTGLYGGLHAGYGWGNADVVDTNGGVPYGPFSYSPSGVFGGGTIGYNMQLQGIVVGVEGELGYMDLSGSGRLPSSNPAAYQTIALDGGFYGLIAARLGMTFDKALIYAKGGWAYYDGRASQTTTNPGYVTHDSNAFNGWVLGAGVEYALTSGMSVKAEYLHFDFGKQGGDQQSISDPPIGYRYTNETSVTADTIKLGLNIKF